MARATGPLGSLSASGSLAGILNYQNQRGRQIVRTKPTPTGAPTAVQVSARASMAFISPQWLAALSAADRATWDAEAVARTLSPQQIYLGQNLKRAAQYEPPLQAWPANPLGSPASVLLWTVSQPLPASLRIFMSFSAANDGWGIELHRSSTTGFTPDRTTLTHIQPQQPTSPMTWFVPTPPSGMWFFRIRLFSTDGQHVTNPVQRTWTII